MGYTHYWRQKRPFTAKEWENITAESKRIVAKAIRGLYSGPETFKTAQESEVNSMGFREGFAEAGAWRTFPNEERKTPMQGDGIKLAGSSGAPDTQPLIDDDVIALNGAEPEDYESFVLEREPKMPSYYGPDRISEAKKEGIFAFCKTEYRAYDPVVVSILYAAKTIAPDAITLTSDGGNEVFRQMF